MVWYIIKVYEDIDNIIIAYSYEKNNTCDGKLKYNKIADEITIEKLSDGADDFDTKRLFPHIFKLLDKKQLSTEKTRIAIG